MDLVIHWITRNNQRCEKRLNDIPALIPSLLRTFAMPQLSAIVGFAPLFIAR